MELKEEVMEHGEASLAVNGSAAQWEADADALRPWVVRV